MQQFVYKQATSILTDKKVLNKDRVAALDVALKLRNSIDDLEGTTAPTKVSEIVVAEMYEVFSAIIVQANPEQRHLYTQLILQRLKGTGAGAHLLGAANNRWLYVDDDSEPEDAATDDAVEEISTDYEAEPDDSDNSDITDKMEDG
jgi:hypothetical protein